MDLFINRAYAVLWLFWPYPRGIWRVGHSSKLASEVMDVNGVFRWGNFWKIETYTWSMESMGGKDM
mgnify:CR=1 FL=1